MFHSHRSRVGRVDAGGALAREAVEIIDVVEIIVGRFGAGHGRLVPVGDARRVQRGLTLDETPDPQVAEVRELLDVDDTLLVQLQDGEKAHDHVEAFGRVAGDEPEGDELALREMIEHDDDRVGDTRPDRRDVIGVDDRRELRGQRPAGRRQQLLGPDPFERIGDQRPERLLGPAARATIRSTRRISAENAPRRVLERLALEQAGEQQVALLEAQQVLVEVEVGRRREERRVFSSTKVAAMSRNSVATSRSRDSSRSSSVRYSSTIGAKRELPQVDLLAQDEVQQEVERPFVDGGTDLVSHVGSEGIGRLGASRLVRSP